MAKWDKIDMTEPYDALVAAVEQASAVVIWGEMWTHGSALWGDISGFVRELSGEEW